MNTQVWRTTACSCALFLAGAIAGSRAQQAASPQQTFRSGVDVVHVDVSVLDKDRNPVRGLTPDDFVVREDGKVRLEVAGDTLTAPVSSTLDLPRVLAAAAKYLAQYEKDVSAIVAEETYTQRWT